MFVQNSAPDPYVINELGTDPTILPGWRGIDGLTQVDPRLVAGEKTGVILCGGQSLMGNYTQTPFTPVNAKVQVLNPYNGGIYQVGSTSLPGAGGVLDHIGKRIADKLITDGEYARVILVPIAISSTTFADWAVGGAVNHRIGVASRRLASLGLAANFVLWGQGESDNVFATSQASCSASLASIFATIRGQAALAAAPIVLSFESYYLGTTSSIVRAAQAAAVDGTSVIAGPDLDTLNATNRYDNIHWNATGAAAAAVLWAAPIENWLATH